MRFHTLNRLHYPDDRSANYTKAEQRRYVALLVMRPLMIISICYWFWLKFAVPLGAPYPTLVQAAAVACFVGWIRGPQLSAFPFMPLHKLTATEGDFVRTFIYALLGFSLWNLQLTFPGL